jgi:hypothetical protein
VKAPKDTCTDGNNDMMIAFPSVSTTCPQKRSLNILIVRRYFYFFLLSCWSL